METINIGGKPYKVSKDVKVYINWLIAQLAAKEKLAIRVKEIIEEIRREQLNKIDTCLDEIENYHY